MSANACAKFLKLGSTVIVNFPYSCKARFTAVLSACFSNSVFASLSLQFTDEKAIKLAKAIKLIFLIIFISFYSTKNTKCAVNNK